MTALRSIPREVRWTVPLALVGLALAVPFSAPDGTGMQWDELVLTATAASAAWALFRAARGTTNPPHVHLGPADFYVLSGVLEYRGGVARAGDWIYEPNGAVHEATHHPEETVYLANVHGAIAFTGADGQIVGLSDWRAMQALEAQQGGGARRT
jgi:quercetin dioxygenase-like cupin family protein